ncbi:MAG: hypothetical protein CO189_07935 [candidate division Zixibacteria bacterium CG_4_9_14_3_um_filter_46_8]|nr:MAG: hypothetical protein CO189_07935 [candidate division Zixibacteria bacterium CG_4_9_14_3_um_filter_46_8]
MEVKMKLADINRKNWTETLSLEWSATYRYKMQTAIFNNPRIVAIIDGIMRNESDHIDIAQKHLLPEFEPKVKGFQTILFFLYLNLEFERFANKSYAGFAREAEDPRSKEDFLRLVKSEGGHAKIFREMIEQIENGNFPVVIICPVCGWELDFGSSPKEGAMAQCEKCKVEFRLVEKQGDWDVERI